MDKQDMCKAQYAADKISEHLTVAYYLQAYGVEPANFHLEQARLEFEQLAEFFAKKDAE